MGSIIAQFGMKAVWLAALVFFLVVEGAVPGLVSIWFALGALAALISSFFAAPFWLQGAFIGAIAGVLGMLAQKLLYGYIANAMSSYQIVTVIPYVTLERYYIVGFLAVGILMGFIGSVISLRKYLRV